MRALAIILVVAAHAGVPGMQGGFIGVDIFFVVSGYLISGLLAGEHARTGGIDMVAFYARRFRRLLPALLVMLWVIAVAVFVLLPPADQPYQTTAGTMASAWVSNLYFAFGQIDYFGATAESNVYLHTWSLGVEEQFYIVWPCLLLLLLLPRGKHSGRGRLAWGMAAILLASLAACIWVTSISTRHAFYLMPLRAWQFAAGALAWMIGMVLSKDGERRDSLAQALGGGGIALLLATLVLVDVEAAYPGAWAILPTSATVLLLLSATAGKSLPVQALSARPMQAIGRLSYGWYLWHWPVLVLGSLLFPGPGLPQRIAMVMAALAFAAVSYRVVERPVRLDPGLVGEPRRFILASLLLMLASALLFASWGNTTPASRTTASTAQATAKVGTPSVMPVIYSMGCDDFYGSDRLKPCAFGPGSAPRIAVVIGDSIGLQWFPAYADVFAAPEWRLIVLTKSSCPMVDAPVFNPRIGREFTECARWRDKALDYIARVEPDIVIMGSSHGAAYDRATWISGTQRVLARIAPHSGRVLIMRSTPVLPFSGPACAWAHRGNGGGAALERACSAPSADMHNDEVASWLQQAAAGWENVALLDMNDAVCPGGVCSAVRDGIPVYRDSQHLTAGFVEKLADRLRGEIDNALASSNE